MAKGFAAPKVTLTADERAELTRCTRRTTTARLVAQRAQAILLAADGMNSMAIAEEVGVGRITVGKWRKRFVEKRLEASTTSRDPARPASTATMRSRR